MDDRPRPAEVPDPRLWVRLAPGWTPDPGLRWYIAGSSLTHRGHFHVCRETGYQHRTVNVGDVTETSPEAAIWINGFLHGQLPKPEEFLGRDDALILAEDAEDERRWRDWNRRFLARGFEPSRLGPLPPRDPRLSDLGVPLAWCYVGDRYRTWVDGDWRLAEPQPETPDESGWFWPGSECETAGAHELCDDGDLTYCERCHLVEA
jgi:hypothetical protein